MTSSSALNHDIQEKWKLYGRHLQTFPNVYLKIFYRIITIMDRHQVSYFPVSVLNIMNIIISFRTIYLFIENFITLPKHNLSTFFLYYNGKCCSVKIKIKKFHQSIFLSYREEDDGEKIDGKWNNLKGQ
jgi:hypothetical protein